VDEFQLSARQKFLARIVDPDVFFLLLLVGVLGLYTEFTHPGVIAPGVIGGICAVLALLRDASAPREFRRGGADFARLRAFHNGSEIRKSRRSPHWRRSFPCFWARSF